MGNSGKKRQPVWFCSECEDGPFNALVDISCPCCDHHRCKDCHASTVRAEDGSEHVELMEEMLNPFIQAGKTFCLPLMIQGIKHFVVPDSGCKVNIANEASLASLVGADALPKAQQTNGPMHLTTADGRSLELRDSYHLKCAFPDDEAQFSMVFYTVQRLASDISFVLCADFVKTFKVFTSNRHRLVERATFAPTVPRILRAGDAGPRLSIRLDSIFVTARADTGSELDMVSRKFVARYFLQADMCHDGDEQRVELIDGRIVSLDGKLTLTISVRKSEMAVTTTQLHDQRSPPFEGGEGLEGKPQSSKSSTMPQKCVFYVLDGLSDDVVLSQQTLHSMDAFRRCSMEFDSTDCALGIFKVRGDVQDKNTSPRNDAELQIAIEEERQSMLPDREALDVEMASLTKQIEQQNLDQSEKARLTGEIARLQSRIRDQDATLKGKESALRDQLVEFQRVPQQAPKPKTKKRVASLNTFKDLVTRRQKP